MCFTVRQAGNSGFFADFPVCAREHAFDFLEGRSQLAVVPEAAFIGNGV
jgi:hypothetical protein